MQVRKTSIFVLAALLSLSISLPIGAAAQRVPADSLRSTSASISHLQLKGTLFTRSLRPLAVIEDTRSGQITMYELGDTIEGIFEIIHISRGEVSFKAQKGEYKLSFPAGAIWQPRASFSDGDKDWYNVRREGDTFIVDKGTVAGAIPRIRDIMTNVRIKPYFMDGKKSGVMVTSLAPVGILKEIGVRKGDVIKSINGLKLNTPYQIFSAYRNLRNQQELRVDLIRDKKPLLLTYRIGDAPLRDTPQHKN